MQELKLFQQKINPALKAFFQIKKIWAKKQGSFVLEAVKALEDFTLRDGKRVRSFLLQTGYLSVNNRETGEILKASLSMELIHDCFLVHDDMIDNDEMRRSRPTLHREWAKRLREKDGRWGESFALLCGDLAMNWAFEQLAEAEFESSVKLSALKELNKLINQTLAGEILDVFQGFKPLKEEVEILKIYSNKTAAYTFQGPLIIGCLLGQGNAKQLWALNEYGLAVGIAFQIYDDLLGIFSESRRLGKDVGSDLKEGKNTLLMFLALKKAKLEDRRFLLSFAQGKAMNQARLEKIREIFVKTQAYEICLKKSQTLIAKAQEIINKADLRQEVKEVLIKLADYVIVRDK